MEALFNNISNPPVGEDGLVACSVIAEGAPIGVQLWPTRTPELGYHFTLRSVALVRNEVRSWVVWTYEDNQIRTFDVGDRVTAKLTLADYERAAKTCKIEM